ncbi:hypothetical protein [Pseudoruegeria sp. HB172150]|uniref:hypothetical protein n=1 Tax=Pseudoruegeria sp. HB172150 TaxID=2721164 RepID=UPI001555A838|nr:hypothetical protein [Pseudoruegeria sp. HB172150]
MNWTSKIKAFLDDESGAVTVDWVVLTAALIGLALAIMATIGGSAQDVADEIATTMTERGIPEY